MMEMEAYMDRGNARRDRRPIANGAAMKVIIVLLACFWAAPPAAAQFDSGSTGVNGAFPPLPAGTNQIPAYTQFLIWNMSTGLVRYCSEYDMANVPETCRTELATGQIPGIPEGGLTTGVFNFTSVDIAPPYPWYPINIFLVGNTNNSPLTILSQNAIHFGNSPYYGVGVSLYANGLNGASTTTGVQPNLSVPGGRPGPGGFAGGAGGATGPPPATGSGGFGPAGGVGGKAEGGSCVADVNHTFGFGGGASPVGAAPVPLVGGSGGGGGGATTSCGFGRNNGAAGGGGGGAVLMASSTQIKFDNSYLYLYGGNGGAAACGCFVGGGGSGGTLRLVAPTLISTYTAVYLYGGTPASYVEQQGAGGTIRVEGDTTQFNVFPSGQSTGTVVATPGPLLPPNTPTLHITSVGDIQVPPAPSGNVNTPDVTFQTPPADPVTVTLAASNIPLGTSAKIRVTPQSGSFTEVTSSAFSGSTASSSATASVTIPPGFGAITASATFSCDGTICAILPPREREGAVVEVVAAAGRSRAFVVTKEGRRVELSN